MKDIVVEKITLYISSRNKYDNLTSIVDKVKELGEMNEFTLIDWDNPTEYKLVESVGK
tara:strand:+ start:492 stop:665 length:174 start_codon:yes stop_codon:yes gene_type:complete